MPVYKTIKVSQTSKVLIWKIEESLSALYDGLFLTSKSNSRLQNMKSELQKKGFLSVRHLLKQQGYSDSQLVYDSMGKPYLTDGKHISITHSFTFSAVFICEDDPVGIDIEKQRDKIVKIAPKFTPIQQVIKTTKPDDLITKLTVIWAAKESLYKIYGKKKLNFLDHIHIDDFKLKNGQTTGRILYRENIYDYKIYFLYFEGFICIYSY